jgi:hypothetical protein
MSTKENKLRVKYSNFQTDMSFNEWAQTFKVSTLVPEQFDRWDGKLDKCDEQTRRFMITSLYDTVKPDEIRKGLLSSIIEFLNKKLCQEKIS